MQDFLEADFFCLQAVEFNVLFFNGAFLL